MNTRICTQCKTNLDEESMFVKNGDYFRSICKRCTKLNRRGDGWKTDIKGTPFLDRAKDPRGWGNHHRRHIFKLSQQLGHDEWYSYAVVLAGQDHKCECCKTPLHKNYYETRDYILKCSVLSKGEAHYFICGACTKQRKLAMKTYESPQALRRLFSLMSADQFSGSRKREINRCKLSAAKTTPESVEAPISDEQKTLMELFHIRIFPNSVSMILGDQKRWTKGTDFWGAVKWWTKKEEYKDIAYELTRMKCKAEAACEQGLRL